MTEPNGLALSSGDVTSPDDVDAEPDFTAAPSRVLELAIAIVALALSVTALILSQNIRLRMGGGGIDPKWWPTVLSIAGATLSAILLGMAAFWPPLSRGEVEASTREGWVRMLLALALSALYVYAWSTIGYLIPTVLFTAILLWVFGLRSWKGLVIFPIATTAFIYGLFHYLLRVPL